MPLPDLLYTSLQTRAMEGSAPTITRGSLLQQVLPSFWGCLEGWGCSWKDEHVTLILWHSQRKTKLYHLYYRILRTRFWMFHVLGSPQLKANPVGGSASKKVAVLEKNCAALTHPVLGVAVW